jgi:hypothetical protein
MVLMIQGPFGIAFPSAISSVICIQCFCIVTVCAYGVLKVCLLCRHVLQNVVIFVCQLIMNRLFTLSSISNRETLITPE